MVLRIGLGDFSEGDVGALEGVLQALDRTVAVGVDGVVHLHLQNQVGAALQVKAQVDALLHRSPQALQP